MFLKYFIIFHEFQDCTLSLYWNLISNLLKVNWFEYGWSRIRDLFAMLFQTHSPRKSIEKRDLKCHRDGILKSISSFCKSCNNQYARTFRIPDNYGHREAELRLRPFALQNRRSERLTKGSETASSVLDLIVIRTSSPYFLLDLSQLYPSLNKSKLANNCRIAP